MKLVDVGTCSVGSSADVASRRSPPPPERQGGGPWALRSEHCHRRHGRGAGVLSEAPATTSAASSASAVPTATPHWLQRPCSETCPPGCPGNSGLDDVASGDVAPYIGTHRHLHDVLDHWSIAGINSINSAGAGQAPPTRSIGSWSAAKQPTLSWQEKPQIGLTQFGRDHDVCVDQVRAALGR